MRTKCKSETPHHSLACSSLTRMGKKYKISVYGIKGEKKTIDVANSEEEFNNTTISAFNVKLLKTFPDLKDAQYRLMYTDRELSLDYGTFSDHHIMDNSSILVIARLPGGGDGRMRE